MERIGSFLANWRSFIKHLLCQKRRQVLMEDLEKAYQEQANDPDFQKEISAWDIAVGDGLDA